MEFCFLFRKPRSTQETVTGTFSFGITKTLRINSTPKIRVKFMLIQVTKIKCLSKSLIPMGLCILKIEFSTVKKLINCNFMNLEMDGRFLILPSSLFHSLIHKEKKVLLKLFVLLKNWKSFNIGWVLVLQLL